MFTLIWLAMYTNRMSKTWAMTKEMFTLCSSNGTPAKWQLYINFRQASPRLHKKRGSCPNTAELVKQNVLVRSVTSEAIPNFTLPPERIQPRSPFERSATSSAFQYQQDFLESFQPELYLWDISIYSMECMESKHKTVTGIVKSCGPRKVPLY